MDVTAKLRTGTKLYQTGQLQAAAKVYAEIMRAFPEHPDALHLSGLVAHQQGNVEQAVRLIERAIQHKPDHPVYLKNISCKMA